MNQDFVTVFFSNELTMLNLIYFPDKYQLMCFFQAADRGCDFKAHPVMWENVKDGKQTPTPDTQWINNNNQQWLRDPAP